ncbi:FMN-linked oxidoreductase [Hypoxylon fragiforme]|uniref:FMN-linked oxidoreductase n=1 Tax=Hypoxylon fragiforme TaxID=63214 RepID=UPI0020C69E88|nr:FMN-linked oxidoreductase [Hypoxylon fragiforme]KAI2612722.1 FMN-linked oxidoreductase [Hypoxylon fragiforme]
MAQTSRLFQPLKVGNATLGHRVVMAPLTRFRSDDNHVVLPFVKEYYGQRASVPGTLLISEATLISKRAGGYSNVPGIWSKEQITAWKEVTDTVHAKGSYIYLQLWALGRVAHPEVVKADGYELRGASAIPYEEDKVVPRELTVEEIQDIIADYAQGARNAIEAGFDGVELHGANGYLIDQFIQDVSNKRQDQYGGSIENRARFALEATSAVVAAIGADKVAIRLSPRSDFQGMLMDDPVPQFTYVIQELKKLKLAYLHVIKAYIDESADVESTEKITFAVDAWDNVSPVFVAGGFKAESAKSLVDERFKDKDVAVVFGRYFISTPDLPFVIQKGLPLQKYNRDTFYTVGTKEGYLDYPFSEEYIKANA